MNPEETNPMANPGAAGAASNGMSGNPMDFTAAGNDAKLSMADSLASAEDNLTSAGMAAKTAGTDAIGLDQIGASNPMATMARPDEPLTPAAPVPGSLGSAVSGPTMGMGAPMASGSAPAGNMGVTGSSTGGASGALAGAGMGASTAIPMGSGTSSTTPAASSVPYNPFAVSEPAPVQPKVDMGAATRAKKKPNLMMIVMIGLIAILGVAVVVLAVLWQQAVNNPTIKYVTPPAEEKPVASENLTLTCSRTVGADQGVEGMVGLVSMTEVGRMNYVEGTLDSVAITQSYLFMDAMAAQGMAPMFEQIKAGMPGTVNYAVNDMTVDLSMDLSGDQLSGWSMNLGSEQTAVADLSSEEMKGRFEGAGYTCSEE